MCFVFAETIMVKKKLGHMYDTYFTRYACDMEKDNHFIG